MFRKLFFILYFFSNASYSQNAEKIYSKLNNAVVRVYTYHEDNSQHGQASGVILKDKGWIITNYHVIGDAYQIQAEHNGVHYKLDSIVAMDASKDILILRISDSLDSKLLNTIPRIKVGNSDKLNIGEKIYAIGSPLGLENTITEGIISGLRSLSENGKKLIQISAPISSGSSGGAIVNSKGQLIGISSMVISGATAQNLNFAIPINDVLTSTTSKNGSPEIELKADDYFKYGQSALYRQNYSSAILNFRNALEKNKSQDVAATLYYFLGMTFHKMKFLDSAMYYYNKSLRINKIADTYAGIASVCIEQKNYDSAINFYAQALHLVPDFQEALTGLGKVYFFQSNLEDAKTYLQRALKVNYRNSEALYLLGKIAEATSGSTNAKYFYKQALEINSNFAEAWLSLSRIYMKEGDLEKSVDCQQKAYQLKPSLRNKKKE